MYSLHTVVTVIEYICVVYILYSVSTELAGGHSNDLMEYIATYVW